MGCVIMVRHGEVDSGAGHVLEAAMITCEECGGAAWCVTTLMDDPNDITQDAAFAALDITATGSVFLGLIGKCHYCGHEQCLYWHIHDVGASNGTTITMTNLDAGTANTLAGYSSPPVAAILSTRHFTCVPISRPAKDTSPTSK